MSWNIGALLGILLGGVITTFIGYRYIFFINVPIGAVAVALGLKYVVDNNKSNEKVDLLGMAMTVYGKGGQTRGFLSLNDSINCLALALKNPPMNGEYRVFNQFDEHYSINEVASMVKAAYLEMTGTEPQVQHVDNPKVEKEEHYYNPEHENLKKLGYVRTKPVSAEIKDVIADLQKHKKRLEKLKDRIMYGVKWKDSKDNVTR